MAVPEFMAGYLAGKVLDLSFEKMKDLVFRPCSGKRMAHFLSVFLDTVQRGRKNECLSDILDRYLADEEKREAVYDAYRRVVLTRSSEIGPKIIALETAKVLSGETTAEEAEDVCRMAEVLDDEDYAEMLCDLEKSKLTRENRSESYTYSDDGLSTGLLREDWPRWKNRLYDLGLWQEWHEFGVSYYEEGGDENGTWGAGLKKEVTYMTEASYSVFDLLDDYHTVTQGLSDE